ncbi:MAG: VWA domain-containing protein [Gammaproteobacteria bacterium]
MNERDYRFDGEPASRLEFVKHELRRLLWTLPCRSKIGLGVFTDRQSALLFEPLELCSSRSEIDRVIEALDWRMAWAADSRIGKGLHKTMEMLILEETAIVFLTDGQEAPPVNPRYRTGFSNVKRKAKA